MKNKFLLKVVFVMALAALTAGAGFTQTDSYETPKNTVTVDIGPTIIGAVIGSMGSIVGEEDLSSSGFGIAVQYERQLFQKMSVGGRFAFMAGGLGVKDSYEDYSTPGHPVTVDTKLEISISSFSLEGHARFYPFGGSFFLDGMLGYALLSTSLSGEVAGEDAITHKKEKESVSISVSRSYFKVGAKLGWRIDFGKPGGFIFEPSFGYSAGIGLGDTIGKQLGESIRAKSDMDAELEDFDELFSVLEDFIFIGGPRVSLSFGWKF